MSKYNNSQYGVNGSNGSNIASFYRNIKNEYLKNAIKVYILLMGLILIYVTHQFLMGLCNQTFLKIMLSQVSFWVFLSVYLLLHFFYLTYSKFSPSLIKVLEKELHYLDLHPQKKYKINSSFLIVTIISIVIFIFLNFGFYFASNFFTTSFITRILIIYMILGISIPILRGTLYDKLIVNLKESYFIEIEFQVKLIKRKEIESQMVRIYMTSNKLCLKSDQERRKLYNDIADKKWLPRKGRFTISTFLYDPYLKFHEYSTPINFKEHFLNLLSAIRKWDTNKNV